jgi:hypothetical protein
MFEGAAISKKNLDGEILKDAENPTKTTTRILLKPHYIFNALILIMDGLCMHVLFDLTTKIIAEYLWTYMVNFGGITYTSLTNN